MLYLLLVFLKTLKTETVNLKTFSRKSSTVFWFEYVYALDVPEDPEDFLILYISLI